MRVHDVASCSIDSCIMKGHISKETYQSILDENQKLIEQNASLKAELKWLKDQIFNKKSEKRFPVNTSEVLPLFAEETSYKSNPPSEIEVPAHKRRKRGRTEALGDNTESGLRFDEGVEIVVEDIYPKEVEGLSPEEYEIIGQEVSDKLASRVSKTFVHRRIFHKVKIKNSSEILKAPVPELMFARSYLTLSFVVDLILDKTLYSLPIYRQHQRFKFDGFHLSRGFLTKSFNNTCGILAPLAEAQQLSLLLSRILAIDETPMKVGVDKEKHKMKKGYVWPIYGDKDEIVYHYNGSRGASVVRELLGGYEGTILSDGYSAYKSYVEGLKEADLEATVTHATCWAHARRKFVKLEKIRPEEYTKALDFISKLYKIEAELSSKSYSERLTGRLGQSQGIVDDYFSWLRSFYGQPLLATNKLLRDAVKYSLEREDSLRVFLKNPELQLDTNHLEREIRPIAIGRKNFMFCWTEIGAKNLCVAQTLVRTCLLQGVNPREYLIDVLQRLILQREEEGDVSDLIPRLWKEQYAGSPLVCPSQKFATDISDSLLSL